MMRYYADVELEAAEWLRVAERDIRAATSLLRDELWSASAYFCQQAIEKLLKAMIMEREKLEPPRTHDLVELADLARLDLTEEQRTFLTRLTDHAVRSRYPGAEYTKEDVEQLFAETRSLFDWLRAKLT